TADLVNLRAEFHTDSRREADTVAHDDHTDKDAGEISSDNNELSKRVADREIEILKLQDDLVTLKDVHRTAVEDKKRLEEEMEAMKGDVVRKHLAKVEPLEKENTQLREKIERLEDML